MLRLSPENGFSVESMQYEYSILSNMQEKHCLYVSVNEETWPMQLFLSSGLPLKLLTDFFTHVQVSVSVSVSLKRPHVTAGTLTEIREALEMLAQTSFTSGES